MSRASAISRFSPGLLDPVVQTDPLYSINSNFGVKHLQQLIDSKPKYLPTINQVDLHPFMTRTELVKFCESHKIVLEVRVASDSLLTYANA